MEYTQLGMEGPKSRPKNEQPIRASSFPSQSSASSSLPSSSRSTSSSSSGGQFSSDSLSEVLGSAIRMAGLDDGKPEAEYPDWNQERMDFRNKMDPNVSGSDRPVEVGDPGNGAGFGAGVSAQELGDDDRDDSEIRIVYMKLAQQSIKEEPNEDDVPPQMQEEVPCAVPPVISPPQFIPPGQIPLLVPSLSMEDDPSSWPLSRQLSEAVSRRGSMPRPPLPGIVKNGEAGFVAVDGRIAVKNKPDVVGVTNMYQMVTPYASICELSPPRGRMRCPFKVVPALNEITFILICKPKSEPNAMWEVPDMHTFFDVLNNVESRALALGGGHEVALLGTREFRGTWLFRICAKSIPILEQWRYMVAEVEVHGLIFNSYPSDALDPPSEVSVMLKSGLRGYDIEWVAHSILQRNSDLYGRLRIVCSKDYGSQDTTFVGLSKQGWRLAILEGDAQFIDSISRFPSGHQFRVGASIATIRGGSSSRAYLKTIRSSRQEVGRSHPYPQPVSGPALRHHLDAGDVQVRKTRTKKATVKKTPKRKGPKRAISNPPNTHNAREIERDYAQS